MQKRHSPVLCSETALLCSWSWPALVLCAAVLARCLFLAPCATCTYGSLCTHRVKLQGHAIENRLPEPVLEERLQLLVMRPQHGATGNSTCEVVKSASFCTAFRKAPTAHRIGRLRGSQKGLSLLPVLSFEQGGPLRVNGGTLFLLCRRTETWPAEALR